MTIKTPTARTASGIPYRFRTGIATTERRLSSVSVFGDSVFCSLGSFGSSEGVSRSCSRFFANCVISFPLTSLIAPLPNCATFPVMVNSVCTLTFVVFVETSVSIAVMVALALPAPRVSRPSPLITTFCDESSLSS